MTLLPSPTANAYGTVAGPRLEVRDRSTGGELPTTERGSNQDWGIYTDAIRRWEEILATPAPDPTVTGARGGRVLSPYLAEWMVGIPGRVTGVPGLSRNEQLKLIGNGVVPQQAELAIRCLLAILQEGPG